MSKDNSHSWVRISHGWSRTWTTRSRTDNEQETLWDAVRRFCVENEWRPKQNHEDRARNLFAYRLPSGKKTDYTSSAWTITSRRWWSDWVLEIKRLSSERNWELSVLVWWNVEEQDGRRRGNKKRFQYCTDVHPDKKFFISKPFKVIQHAIPLILHFRKMC